MDFKPSFLPRLAIGRLARLHGAPFLTVIFFAVLVLIPARVFATTYTVNVLTDAYTTPRGVGSRTAGDLRYCITQANDGATGSTHTITFAVSGTITLSGHELIVDSNLTITGPGESQLTIDANQASRAFFINFSHTVVISDLTITRGNGMGAQFSGEGGAILNDRSDLTVSRCTLSNNVGGPQPAQILGGGGAIHNRARDADATLRVSFCTITGNSAPDSNGGGGGIRNIAKGGIGTLEITDSTISNNTTEGEGGGIYNYSLGSSSPARATVTRCSIGHNSSTGFHGGGGICSTGDSSGGAASMTVTDSVIFGNTMTSLNSGASGGGILQGGGAFSSADMTLLRCTIRDNNSNKNGGGVSNYAFISRTTMTVSGCTISGNVADLSGGGISNYGVQNAATLYVDNSTLAGNSATQRGGGLFNFTNDTQTGTSAVCSVTNCTIAGNAAISSGAAIANDRPQNSVKPTTVTLANTIMALNPTGANYAGNGSAISNGFNLCDDSTFNKFTAGTGDLINTAAGLRVDGLGKPLLQSNGGPTQTIALLTGSAALDAGKAAIDPLTSQPSANDQRGTSRPFDQTGIADAAGGDGSDIGAFESGTGPVITISALPVEAGTVSGGGQQGDGAGVSLLAMPNPGYLFVSWTENGTIVSTTATYEFTAGAARTLVANFRALTPPAFSIEVIAGQTLSSGGTVAFGSVPSGANTISKTLTIRNSGETELVLGTIDFGGSNGADFSVTSSPASPVAGAGSTTFTIKCSPSSLPGVIGTVQIASNSSTGPHPFELNLTASATDFEPPAVTLAGPRKITATGLIDLAGTVTENFRLASFSVKMNGVPLVLDAPVNLSSLTVQNWSVTGVLPENGTSTIPCTITVEAVDLGGRRATATKTVTFTNLRPALAGIFPALLVPASAPDLKTAGRVRLFVQPSGTFTGNVMVGGTTVAFKGLLNNAGAARFFPAYGTTLELKTRTADFGTLALLVSGPAGMSGTLTRPPAGAVLASFAGQVAPYRRTNLVPAAFLNQPVTGVAIKGVYNVAFLSKAQSPAKDTALYPQGDGYATVTLSNVGAVAVNGWLADNTQCLVSGELRADGTVVLVKQLYGNLGVFTGELALADLADTDISGANFLWLRPLQPKPKTYPGGWPAGLFVDAVGTKYAKPASLDFGQGAADLLHGNASLKFTDGLLTGTVDQAVGIDPATGAVKLIAATHGSYRLALAPATGVLSGSFTHTDNKKPVFRGILLNKGSNRGGMGYFLSAPAVGSTGQSGAVFLDPAGP